MEKTKLKAAGSQEQAGAVVHKQETDLDQLDWEKIDWPAMEREVNRFQARIVKAEQEGRWNKVKSLQYLLTRSRAARLLAVRRVTENQGSKTPGVDGQT
jgi:RNA-directed DNA polymerase